ncbi:unnamed protein product [Chrysoparadoxa australica]
MEAWGEDLKLALRCRSEAPLGNLRLIRAGKQPYRRYCPPREAPLKTYEPGPVKRPPAGDDSWLLTPGARFTWAAPNARYPLQPPAPLRDTLPGTKRLGAHLATDKNLTMSRLLSQVLKSQLKPTLPCERSLARTRKEKTSHSLSQFRKRQEDESRQGSTASRKGREEPHLRGREPAAELRGSSRTSEDERETPHVKDEAGPELPSHVKGASAGVEEQELHTCSSRRRDPSQGRRDRKRAASPTTAAVAVAASDDDYTTGPRVKAITLFGTAMAGEQDREFLGGAAARTAGMHAPIPITPSIRKELMNPLKTGRFKCLAGAI